MDKRVKRLLSITLTAMVTLSSSSVAHKIKAVENPKDKTAAAAVKLGIDNIDNYLDLFKDKKVGLITNPSGIDSNFESSIDVLYKKTNLTTLFAAEHGIRGNSQDGGTVGNEVDVKTGLPVYSIYGSTLKPTPDMLANVDILAYDMQDVGARFYTFINTMAYSMQAAAENNKTFVVFDRPNPVGGVDVQGTILNEKFSSFVGMFPIPQRYGLTVGELAQFINKEYNYNCNLVVVPMTGWTRDMYYDETGLKTWVMPSPNMPTLDTAIVYTGNCLFEGTNVSEGRGTTRPFEFIGAPFINSIDLAEKMNSLKLPGVEFRPVSFTPTFSKYGPVYDSKGKLKTAAQACGGVQTYVVDRSKYNSVKTALALLYTIRDMYPKDFQYRSDNYIDKLTGNSYVREGKYTLKELFKMIDEESKAFKNLASKYYIYKDVDMSNKHKVKVKVRLGIDNIEKYIDMFDGKKVGLITNPSGMNSNFESTIDVLNSKTNLTTLFAAEHGIRGNNQAGGTVGSETDVKTGLPVYSLYGSTLKPTAEMLKDVDILTYDMQDVGARFYTYINTMAYGMQAAAENNKTFIVFDRPNPVSGTEFQGNILKPEFSSFVGMYPIIQRYGLTIGEYAKYINKEFSINCNLVVIPMTGWTRDMYYDETGLKTWVMPSPNMPTLDTAIVYTGNCLFEGTNISEGRGTTRPFELIGAPWINSIDLADKLNSLNIPGVKFRATTFTPQFSKYSSSDLTYNTTPGKAQACGGVQTYVVDRSKYNSVKTALTMIYTIRDMYPDKFKFISSINRLVGDSYVKDGTYTIGQLYDILDNDSVNFKAYAEKYFIYTVR